MNTRAHSYQKLTLFTFHKLNAIMRLYAPICHNWDYLITKRLIIWVLLTAEGNDLYVDLSLGTKATQSEIWSDRPTSVCHSFLTQIGGGQYHYQ